MNPLCLVIVAFVPTVTIDLTSLIYVMLHNVTCISWTNVIWSNWLLELNCKHSMDMNDQNFDDQNQNKGQFKSPGDDLNSL